MLPDGEIELATVSPSFVTVIPPSCRAIATGLPRGPSMPLTALHTSVVPSSKLKIALSPLMIRFATIFSLRFIIGGGFAIRAESVRGALPQAFGRDLLTASATFPEYPSTDSRQRRLGG
jgi:hypothetical protein